MNIDKLTEQFKRALMDAQSIALGLEHGCGISTSLQALLNHKKVQPFLCSCKVALIWLNVSKS